MGSEKRVLPGWLVLWCHPWDQAGLVRISNPLGTLTEVLDTLAQMRSRGWGFAGLVATDRLMGSRMGEGEISELLGFRPEMVVGLPALPASAGSGMEEEDSETTLHYADPPYLHATRTARKV